MEVDAESNRARLRYVLCTIHVAQIRFANDPYLAAAHYMLGRFLSTLILLRMLVFIASFIRHKQRALWGLLLVTLLLFPYVLWGFWTCC